MSENQNQEPAPNEQPPLSQNAGSFEPVAPVAESFGDPFPAGVDDAPALSANPISAPTVANKQPGEASPDAPQAPAAYTSPQFYNQPPVPNPPPPSPNPPSGNMPPPGYILPPGYALPPSYMPPPGYALPPGYMPPPGYAVPPGYVLPPGYMLPPGYIPQPAMPVKPLPLGKAISQLPGQYWRVLTHPKASTFAAEQGKAAWNIIWMQLLFQGIVQALAVLAIVLLEFFLFQAIFPADSFASMSQVLPIIAAIFAAVALASAPISFFIGAGIYHLFAKAFKGQGSFLAHCYNYSLIVVPISMLTTVAALIPCIGNLVLLGGVVYQVILLIYMVMGTHRLSGGKASAAVLIPVGIATVLIVGGYVAYFFWILTVMQNLKLQP